MVIWSDEAKADLRMIYEFIAKDSKHYGRKVIQEIAIKADILDSLPRLGRPLPGDENPCGQPPAGDGAAELPGQTEPAG